MTKKYFDAVDPKINFPEMEKDLLEQWYKDGIVDKYLNKNKSSKKYFSFQDGPITANNPMGVHHAWGRTYKDLWPRFYSMRGYNQRHQNGFDCQGLWVEVEVEKELGFKSKKDIEKFGVGKFVDLCKSRVKKYSAIQTEQSKRLGYFADWDNSYYTLSDDNNYMIWHFLKTCHRNGWLYKGKDVVPWCPRCETAISQHEMLTEDYKEVSHETVYVAVSLINKKNEKLVYWTTTPWTVPANMAVAVDKKLNYVLVEDSGSRYWVEESRKKVLFGKNTRVIKKVKGQGLVGLGYVSPYDHLPYVKTIKGKEKKLFHTVIATDDLLMPITTTEGTGLVHTSTSTGQEDHKLGKKIGLPLVQAINDKAEYLAGFGELEGKNAKKDPRLIIDFLKEKGSLFKTEKYTHRYPACWRCKEELVWKVTDEWYISMDKGTPTLRERMKKVTKKINWMPSFGLKRELDWLENMHDWLISKKNRYWGLALPIWECSECGNFEVVGGRDELKKKVVSGWDEFEGKSPHKPQIDKLKLKCSKCGEKMDRIEPVGNPWLDAGIVPFSTISENNKACQFEPTNTKPLYLEDRKKWLNWYPVDFITESFPGQFKNWFYSMIVMSTVLEDREPFKNVLGFATLLAEDGRPMHKSWGNSLEFNESADRIGVDVMRWMYVRQNPTDNMLFGYKIADDTRRRFHLKLWNIYNYFVTYANIDEWSPSSKNLKSASILDQWIMLCLDEVIASVTSKLEKYDAYGASGDIDKFVDDLSLWYIRRSREREDKNNFYATTSFVLTTLSKLLAPFTPFISEAIYKNLTKKESVHLSSWPKIDTKGIQTKDAKNLLSEMQTVRSIVEVGHSIRKDKQIAVRQPLSSFKVKDKEFNNPGLEQLILDELNVKSIKYNQKEYMFDTKITPQLEEEAKTRELVRKIQNERKKIGVNLSDKVNISSKWLPNDKNLVAWLKKKTLANTFEEGEFSVEKV